MKHQFVYGCRDCDYDICLTCIDLIKNPKIPQLGHETMKINPDFMSVEHRKFILSNQIQGISQFNDKYIRNDGIKRLLSIFNNILQNPSDLKYQNLNFTKLRSKFSSYPTFIHILFTLGFDQIMEDNKSRLKIIKFDAYNMDLIFIAYNQLHNILYLNADKNENVRNINITI